MIKTSIAIINKLEKQLNNNCLDQYQVKLMFNEFDNYYYLIFKTHYLNQTDRTSGILFNIKKNNGKKEWSEEPNYLERQYINKFVKQLKRNYHINS